MTEAKSGRFASVVVPSHNEERNIPVLHSRLEEVFAGLPGWRFEVIFVDDGSSDSTLSAVKALAERKPEVYYIEFSRNFGHQPALLAGLHRARGDVVISMDADLQHPPQMIPEMIRLWEAGAEVVYTLRMEDERLPLLKRVASNAFYSLSNMLSDHHIEPGAADFRLMDRKVIDVVCSLSERDPFLRGITSWIGFRQAAIPYQPDARHAGESKYTLKKMMRLALNGITSFSVRPLYFAVYAGLAFAALSLLFAPYVVVSILIGRAVPGWASLLLAIVFFGGLQLIVLGIMGIYLGQVFMQTKQRPIYIVRSTNTPPRADDSAHV